jgi:N-sulfoglucosamine sulfohydrolase
LLDITPTILDWFGLPVKRYPYSADVNDLSAESCKRLEPGLCLPGRSLLSVLDAEPSPGAGWDEAFASQSLHEVTMYYPMRAIRTRKHRLIHNMAYRMPFPIDQDFYVSPTFQDLLHRTHFNKSLNWFTTLRDYYYRNSLELYDVQLDPQESTNLALDTRFTDIVVTLFERLTAWQNATDDPWICAQNSVLVQRPGSASYCESLFNDL